MCVQLSLDWSFCLTSRTTLTAMRRSSSPSWAVVFVSDCISNMKECIGTGG